MNKKIFGSLITFSTILLALVGCGGQEGNDSEVSEDTVGEQTETVELTFWNGFTASDGEILQEIVDDFNAENDHIDIQMEVMTWANFNEQLPSTIAAGNAPDFVLMNNVDFAQYVNNGAMLPLDDFWDLDTVDQGDFAEESIELGIVDGTQYFIPMQVQGMFTYWNKDIFEDAGLDSENPPTTWDELMEIAPQLVDPAQNRHGFTFNYDGPAILYNWIIQNGGHILNEDQTESAFSSPENLEVLENIRMMVHEEQTGPSYISGAELDNLLFSEQIGIHMNGPWLNNGLRANEVNYGVTTVPQVNPDDPYAVLEGVGFGIPSTTEEDKIELIYEFISHWNTAEIGKKWSIENGFPAYLQSVVEDPEVQENPIVLELSKQIEFAEPLYPGNTDMPTINSDIIVPMLESLLAGEDAETLMNQAHDDINALLGN